MRSPSLLVAALLLALCPSFAANGQSSSVSLALVVHPGVVADSISADDAIDLLMGKLRSWPNGDPVVLLLPGPSRPERRAVLRRVYRMSEAQYRQYWIGRMYRTEVPVLPREIDSCTSAQYLAGRLLGALAVVAASCLQEGVEVLTVGGSAPDDPDYPLR